LEAAELQRAGAPELGGNQRAGIRSSRRRRFMLRGLALFAGSGARKWWKQQFELSRGGQAGNVLPMEGLRGIAVILVFLVHYVNFTLDLPPNHPIVHWISPESCTATISKALRIVGNTGVDLFFVLSGYLIYGSLITRPQSFFRFMRRRIERLYPTFTAVFALYLTLFAVNPEWNRLPPSWMQSLWYLLENYLLLPGIFPIQAMITVAWSLSYGDC
jgi:peptidoglycan/LPS O-acetylase OafA/YrhL